MKKTRGKQKQKIKADYGMGDMHKLYQDGLDSIEKGSELDQPRKVYGDICRDFNEAVSNMVIFESFCFKIPYRMGEIRGIKSKQKLKFDENGVVTNLPVDQKATKELWEKNPIAKEIGKKVYHTNDHTDGYVHSFFFDKKTSDAINQSAYAFRPTRTHKRTLAAALKDPEVKINHYE